MRRRSEAAHRLHCNSPEQACIGKAAYPNATMAYRHARGITQRTSSPNPAKVYRCEYCGQWHVSSDGRRRP